MRIVYQPEGLGGSPTVVLVFDRPEEQQEFTRYMGECSGGWTSHLYNLMLTIEQNPRSYQDERYNF